MQKSAISGLNASAKPATTALTPFLTLVLKQELVGTDQARLHGIHHHGGRVVHAELGHDVLSMGGHGVRTQEQFLSDLSVGHSLRNELEHFGLPRAQADGIA